MGLLWLLLIVLLVVALISAVTPRARFWQRDSAVDAPVRRETVVEDRGGWGFGGGVVALVAVILLIVLLVSMLT